MNVRVESRTSASTCADETRDPKKSVAMSSIWCASSKTTASYSGMALAKSPPRPARSAEIGEEQVMIDDDEAGLLRRLSHPRNEALIEVPALGPDARVGRRAHVSPHRVVLRDGVELRAVPRVGPLEPGHDAVERGVDQRGCDRLRESSFADVVREPFHHGDADANPERFFEQRHVLGHDLLLQCLGRGGDHHLLAAEDGGHQVRERLAGPCSRLDEQRMLARERVLDRLRHRDLAGPVLVAREALAQQRPGSEDVARSHRAVHSACGATVMRQPHQARAAGARASTRAARRDPGESDAWRRSSGTRAQGGHSRLSPCPHGPGAARTRPA